MGNTRNRESKMQDNDVIHFIDERIERLEEITELMSADDCQHPKPRKLKCWHLLRLKMRRLFKSKKY